MKRRIFAAALAAALILLSACSGGNSSTSSGSSASGSTSSSSSSSSSSTSGSLEGDLSLPDASNPDGSNPDSSSPDASSPDGSSSSTQEPTAESSLSLSKSDFTLFKTGATWQLKAKAEPAGGEQSWKSSNEKVATVDEKGVVTAVGEGSTTITVTDENTGLTASCIVRVRLEEEKPDNGGSSSGSSSSGSGSSSGSSSSGSQSSKVDLSSFASQMMADYAFSHLQLADASLMDDLYSGLSGVSTEQCLVYCTMMTMNNGEFVLVQVKDSKDVDTVKGILQARINYMAGDGENPGGAWYPGPTEQWKNNSRVVSNGNYVMMVVHENCDDIVAAFNDLF